MSASTESPLGARVSRAELVARELEREIAMSHVVFGFRTGTTSYEECLELRDALEPLVDSHAARFHRARDIRELKRILRSMEASVNDSAAFIKCNWALHRRIAEICRNGPLRHIYLAQIDFLEFSIDRAELSDFDGAAIVTIHRDLVEAIDAGEGPELDAAIEAHHARRDRDDRGDRGRRQPARQEAHRSGQQPDWQGQGDLRDG
ncbi:MAG: FCD domain-containing protein [Solirubrobacteraceae bacterium]